MGWLVAFLHTLAYGLNVASILSCSLVSLSGRQAETDAIYGAGLYAVESTRTDYCTFVDFNDAVANVPFWADRQMNSARIVSAIGVFLSFVLLILLWISLCCGCFRAGVYRIIVAFWSLMLCALAGCIFLMHTSDYCNTMGCSFNRGSGLVIGAMITYFVVMCIGCVTKDEEEEEYDAKPSAAGGGGGQTQVTVEKTVQADGTTIMKTTTTHPDGTVSVEEKVESPAGDDEEQSPPNEAKDHKRTKMPKGDRPWNKTGKGLFWLQVAETRRGCICGERIFFIK
mmetsp:Transcript_13702/g.25713  ORF Transcript_13702/g.25713 Transcript_13702/m.25713 type:complete len:283 (-) Transcript_13702:9-857(-)